MHFYTHDRQFECVWKDPYRYLPIFKRFEGIITPDYSLYYDMPLSMQIWNTYRNRVLAYWLQSEGLNIVPNVRWGDERTYSFAFEGMEQGGTVAVSSLGTIRNKYDRYLFLKGFKKMVYDIEPDIIVFHGSMPKEISVLTNKLKISTISVPSRIETVHKDKGSI